MTSPLPEAPMQDLAGFPDCVRDTEALLRREGFTVGKWRVEPRRHRIVWSKIDRRLDPRLMSVLVALAVAPGEVVTRAELLETVWKETFVSENSLSKAISRLRRALSDEHNDPHYIETISKSGYRLVATVGRSQGHRTVAAAQPVVSAATADGHRPLGRGLWWLAASATLIVALLILCGKGKSRPLPLPRVRPELTLVGNQFEPRLAPGGGHVAFAWQGKASSWDIWVQPIGADNPVQVTDHPFHERLPAWSPDGQRLAFVRFSGPDPVCGIFAAQLVGRSEERLADCTPGIRSLAWSPDGEWLAHDGFVDEDTEIRVLFLVDLVGGQRRQLTHPPTGVLGDTSVRFSPDGTMLAFEREVGPYRHDVAVVAVADGETRMLTFDRWGQVRGLDWSSDGTSVVYSSNRAGQFALWRVPVTGGDPRRVPIDDSWVTQPSVSRAGGRLIYRTFRDSVDIWELPLGDNGEVAREPIRRVSSSRSERQPVWSPRDDVIAFVSDRSGSTELWSGLPDGSELMRHTNLQGPRPASPAWSPDGQRLVFDAAVDGHADLWIVERQSRRPIRLTVEPSEERNGRFSRDGSRIYFASDRGDGWNIWRMATAGSGASQATTDGGFLAQESPDGQSLYFVRLDEPGIWCVPVNGGAAVQVLSDLNLSDWGSWEVADRGIYYLRRGPTTLGFAPFDGSSPRLLYVPSKQVPYLERALSLSHDGRALLFSQIGHSDDEVMTVDLVGL